MVMYKIILIEIKEASLCVFAIWLLYVKMDASIKQINM